MILSTRERIIAIVTALAVGALLADRYVLTPVLDRQAQLDAERSRLESELAQARALFVRKKRLAPKWRAMLAAGLAADPGAAESRVLHAVRDWSQASGLTLSSLKPERVLPEQNMLAVTFRASGAGPMRAVAGFLYRVQTAALPVKITELQIAARQAGKDDLSVQVRLSALCRPASGDSQTEGGGDR